MAKINPTFNQQSGISQPYEDINSSIFIDRYGDVHDSATERHPIKVRLGAFLIAYSQGHILLTSPPWAPTVAELPGGGVNPHETVEGALQRELEEETGLKLSGGLNPVKADKCYINLYAEDVSTYYRYLQKFYYFDLSSLIHPNDDQGKVVTPEGSKSFWHPVDRLDELNLRVGHRHIIESAVNFFTDLEKTAANSKSAQNNEGPQFRM
jgi:8-oxo-dGTP pyrophosphatase MutT (NUDIX family)